MNKLLLGVFFTLISIFLLLIIIIYIKNIKQENLPLDSFKIYTLINEYRTKNNLSRLSWNPTICDYSNIRLKQIHIDWSHNGFYNSPPTFFKNYDIKIYIGENLIKGIKPEPLAVKAWINSPEHLKNIMNSHYIQTCVSADNEYAVQEFASNF